MDLCRLHYERLQRHGDPLVNLREPVDPAARFWAKVDKSGDCWHWTAAHDGKGYGLFRVKHNQSHVRAHRYAYELLVGPIPDGLVLDHLCRTPSCVRPSHLEPVTSAENTRRSDVATASRNAAKTHCSNGHEFTEANTLIRPNGTRACRECKRIEGRSDRNRERQRQRRRERMEAGQWTGRRDSRSEGTG